MPISQALASLACPTVAARQPTQLTQPSACRLALRPLFKRLPALLLLSAGAVMAAPFAYIPNATSNNVSVIDLATNAVVGTPIPVGGSPLGVAVNQAGTFVYIPNRHSNNVSVISTATNTVVATIGIPDNAYTIALNGSGTRAYVTTGRTPDSVYVIDTTTNTLVGGPIAVGNFSRGVAGNTAGTRMYVTNSDSNSISVIDTNSNTVVSTVLGFSGPFGVALNPSGTRAYITNLINNTVSILDTASNTIVNTVTVGIQPFQIALNPAGTRAYATNFNGGSVSVIDATATPPVVIATILVGGNPQGISLNLEGTRAYVASSSSNNVSVIDTTTNTVLGTPIAVGDFPAARGIFIAQGVAAAQPINFLPLADLVLGSPIPVSTSASTGSPYTSSNTPEVCTIDNTTTPASVVAVSVGTCTLVAIQGSNTAETSFPVGRRTVDVRTYVPQAEASSGYATYLRIINTGKQASAISLAVIDEGTGTVGAPKRLPVTVASGGAVTLSASQIETALGSANTVAAGRRPRLRVMADTPVPIETQTLLRSPQGLFTEVSGAQSGTSINVRTFVPSAAAAYASVLRIINTGSTASPVTVARIDPLTGAVGTPGTLHTALPAGAASSYTASQIEAALGRPLASSDRPRIQVSAPASTLDVQSFLAQPTGGFTEVSGAQTGSSIEVRSYAPASTVGQTSFVRIINAGSNTAANASPITAEFLDERGKVLASGLLASLMPGGAVTTLTSKEMETAIGFAPPVGTTPRLRISSKGAPLEVQSYLLQPNAWFALASNAAVGRTAIVRTYVPQIDAPAGYSSTLRITNTGSQATAVKAQIIDDTTGSLGTLQALVVIDSLAPGATRVISATQLEAVFGIGLGAASTSRLNSGARPRIAFSADQVLQVQSLLNQPGGVAVEVSDGQ